MEDQQTRTQNQGACPGMLRHRGWWNRHKDIQGSLMNDFALGHLNDL